LSGDAAWTTEVVFAATRAAFSELSGSVVGELRDERPGRRT